MSGGTRREKLDELQEELGYQFSDSRMLETALTHRSLAHEEGHLDHYERLEFLGDSVLGLVAAEWLFGRFPDLAEGELARMKSHLVSASILAEHARVLGLGRYLRLGVGEERSGGREKASLLADVMEAVIGALYVDGGYSPARRSILVMLEDHLGRKVPSQIGTDAKSTLQEVVQARGGALPEYRLVEVSGPDHDRTFIYECWIGGIVQGVGKGPSKKTAQRKAAASAIRNSS